MKRNEIYIPGCMFFLPTANDSIEYFQKPRRTKEKRDFAKSFY